MGTIIVILILAGLGAAYEFRLFNRPPKADFEISPNWINPIDTAVTKFTGRCSDPDNDPLTYAWFIDGKQVNTTKDHWAILSAGNQTVRLDVSDGKATNSVRKLTTVDRSGTYPSKKLNTPIKGVNYRIDERSDTFKIPDDSEMEEDLQTIRNELGCNAIRIFSNNNEIILKCAKLAIGRGFTTIALSPVYFKDSTLEETLPRVTKLAEEAKPLTVFSNLTMVLIVGNEITVYPKAFSSLPTYEERVDEISGNAWRNSTYRKTLGRDLTLYLKNLITACRSVGGKLKLTYAPGNWEDVDWKELDADIVSQMVYFKPDNIEWYTKRIESCKTLDKPLWIIEFGAATFEGVFNFGGSAYRYGNDKKYSQEDQANVIDFSLKQLVQQKIDAVFYFDFKERREDDRQSFGLLRYVSRGLPFARKLGFCMYKSYVVTDSSPATESDFEAKHIIPVMLHASFGWLTGTTVAMEQIQTVRNEESKVRLS